MWKPVSEHVFTVILWFNVAIDIAHMILILLVQVLKLQKEKFQRLKLQKKKNTLDSLQEQSGSADSVRGPYDCRPCSSANIE